MDASVARLIGQPDIPVTVIITRCPQTTDLRNYNETGHNVQAKAVSKYYDGTVRIIMDNLTGGEEKSEILALENLHSMSQSLLARAIKLSKENKDRGYRAADLFRGKDF